MVSPSVSLLLVGLGFAAVVVGACLLIAVLVVRAGRVPKRSQVADLFQATAALEARYRDERAKREQAEWEVKELQADVAKLNRRIEQASEWERKADEYDALELEAAELRRVFDREVGRIADAALITTLQLEAVKRHVPGVRDFLATLGNAGTREAPPPQNLGDAPE